MIDSDAVIDQDVPWCPHCGKPKVALLRKYEDDDVYGVRWATEREVEVPTMNKEHDETIEQVWCSSCGVLYHPNSV